MNLYLVERTDSVGYDEFESMVVCARNEAHALQITPFDDVDMDDVWKAQAWGIDPKSLKIRRIGIAASGVAEGPVHLSYKAG